MQGQGEALRDEAPFRVAEGAGHVHGVLQIVRVRGAHQRDGHLVHDGVQRVLDQLEQDGIAQLAGGHAVRLGGGPCPPSEASPQEELRRPSRRSNAACSCQVPELGESVDPFGSLPEEWLRRRSRCSNAAGSCQAPELGESVAPFRSLPEEELRRRSERSNAAGSCQAPVWMTMLLWASRCADPPGGTRVVASYSSTSMGPGRGVASRSCRSMTGVRNTPCVAPK